MGHAWARLGPFGTILGKCGRSEKSENNIERFLSKVGKGPFWAESGPNLTRLGPILANLGLMRNFIQHSFKVHDLTFSEEIRKKYQAVFE